MACPSCDCTMQGLGYGIFHCPRCGTTLNADGSYSIPALVHRCRNFEDQVIGRKTDRYDEVWRRTGIAESINIPANRMIHSRSEDA